MINRYKRRFFQMFELRQNSQLRFKLKENWVESNQNHGTPGSKFIE
jgi:hypothetical protein